MIGLISLILVRLVLSTSLFVFKQCNSKAQKSKSAECSPWRPEGTSCVWFCPIASRYGTHTLLITYYVENGTSVQVGHGTGIDLLSSCNGCLGPSLPR